MRLQRDWITPITLGAFGLMAITGVLLFFHLDSGLNKAAHEWLGWLLVAAVVGHVVVNLPSFRRHLAGRRGRAILAVSVVVLALSFVPVGGGSSTPPWMASVRALADTPITTLATVAGTAPDAIVQTLRDRGLQPEGPQDTVRRIVGDDVGAQMRALSALLPQRESVPSTN